MLDWKPPFAKWFVGGKLNVSYNCLDRHLDDVAAATRRRSSGRASRATRARSPTSELHREVCQFANVLKSLGVEEGRPRRRSTCRWSPRRRSPCSPAPASARRTRSSSAASPPRRSRDRINDAQGEARHHRRRRLAPRQGRPAQGERRRGARRSRPTVENVRRRQALRQRRSTMKPGRDLWWHDAMAKASRRLPRRAARQRAPALHPLHLRLDRQAEGRPAHDRRLPARHARYSTQWVFDLKDDDIYWCTADVGWVTGHSYVVYGPLANGATVVMYEGAPNQPEPDRFWEIIEKYSVTIFYTAPTAIRAFIKWGDAVAAEARPVVAAAARHRRRADQSRSVDVVPRGHRRRAAARSSTPGGRPRPAGS